MAVSSPPRPAWGGRAPAGRGLARRAASVLALGLVLSVGTPACGRSEFEDRTARVEIGGRTTTFTLDSCGLDGVTLFVVGRSTGGETLQAVVGVQADGTTGVPASTGLTVTDEGNELVAFGAESWERRGQSGPPPGVVTSAKLRGSRIQVAGALNTLSDPLTGSGAAPEIGPQDVAFALDARCDDQSI